MYLGSHVSFDSKEQLLKSVKETISYGANTFMFYTGAPQNTKRSSIDDGLTYKAYELMKENGIYLDKVVSHAPYIVNLANDLDDSKYDFSINFLKNEVSRLNPGGIPMFKKLLFCCFWLFSSIFTVSSSIISSKEDS